MDGPISEALLVTLFMFIESIAGYPPPVERPEIHRLPVEAIAERVCGRPCRVRAAYISGEGILIDDSLDIEQHAFAQSVLLHELVHAAQDRDGAFSDLPDCRRHTQREYEAYWVQGEYLQRTVGSSFDGLDNGDRLRPRCFDE